MSDLRQAWECSDCKTLRIYGGGCNPENRRAVLSCVKCGKPRLHTFSHHTESDMGTPARPMAEHPFSAAHVNHECREANLGARSKLGLDRAMYGELN